MEALTKPKTRRLCVGVTGNRLDQIEEHARDKVADAVADALAKIESAARRADPETSLTMVSALAEGSDRFAAEAALAHGWRLVSPLPFKRARYLQDFPEQASKDAFDALAAKADSVIEPGDGEDDGYLHVGLEILARSRLLLAVWNGAPPRGPGGTADVAARALVKGIPVVWLATQEGLAGRLLEPGRRAPVGTFPARLRAELSAAFTITKKPDAMRLAAP